MLLGLIVTGIFSGCIGSTYSYQIGHNTFTSSSDNRSDSLEEATETCTNINSKIKVLKENIIRDDIYIINYKCLSSNSNEYLNNVN